MSIALTVVPLDQTRARDRGRFLHVAKHLYARDPQWVAPLVSEAQRVISPANPFFQHARMQLWVAVRAGRDIGRIAAILDDTHNAVHGCRTVHFGFLESIDDGAVTHALFAVVIAWARAAGCDRVVGPMNPSINDECGLWQSCSPQFLISYRSLFCLYFFVSNSVSIYIIRYVTHPLSVSVSLSIENCSMCKTRFNNHAL
jgi:hypothetical protein